VKLMEQIHSGKQPAPRRILLYGVHGIGKSTWGSMAPKSIFISTEDGLGEIACQKLPLTRSFDDVMQALSELYSEAHLYRTLVVDSVDWLEQLIWQEVCREKNVESIEEIGYAKGYVFALTQWRNFLAGLEALRADKGMMVILIGHAKIEKFENPETENYDRYCPHLHKSASAIIQEWCDEVLFATYRVHIKQTKEGFDKTIIKGIGTGERIIRTTERPAHVAKNRLNLPDELPLDWNAYAKFLTEEHLGGGKAQR